MVNRYQKKHSPTYTSCGHQSSLICCLHLYDPWHPPYSIYVSDSFFHNLTASFLWSTLGLAPSASYSIHFFTQSLSFSHDTCPYHHSLFCCSTKNMSSNPSLSLSPLLGTLSCSLMPHIHLTILITDIADAVVL